MMMSSELAARLRARGAALADVAVLRGEAALAAHLAAVAPDVVVAPGPEGLRLAAPGLIARRYGADARLLDWGVGQ